MSGPKTARYRIAAEARAKAREEAARRRQEHLARLRSAVEACEVVDAEWGRLRAAAASLKAKYPSESFTIPDPSDSRPATDDVTALTLYAQAAKAALDEAQRKLMERAAHAGANKDFSITLQSVLTCLRGEPQRISEVATLLAPPQNNLPPSEMRGRQDQCARILGRLRNPNGVPIELQTLAIDYINAHSTQRAKALEDELRLRVANLNAGLQKQQRDQEAAKKLLAALDEAGENENCAIHQELQRIACGAGVLSAELQAQAETAANRKRASDVEADKRQAAHLVREALTELGYTVEPIQETLFVQGGTVHFQRADWGEYFVRLRVRPESQEVNFNVVRTIAGQQNETYDRSTLDTEAEATWCRDFSSLLKGLQRRGVTTELNRHLTPGTVPVQAMDASEISLATDGQRKPRSKASLHKRGMPPP